MAISAKPIEQGIKSMQEQELQMRMEPTQSVKRLCTSQRSAATSLVETAPSPARAAWIGHAAQRMNRRTQAAENRLLARLHALLLRMPASERRTVLEGRLGESQRQALERWILAQRTVCPPACHRVNGRRHTKICQPKRTAACASKVGVPGRAALDSSQAPDGKASAKTHGVSRNIQKGGCFYTAQLSIGNLRLMSKADRNLGVVLAFRDVLVSIRQRLLSASMPRSAAGIVDGAFESRFRAAVHEALAEWSADATSMGLRFKVCIRPLWVSKPLSTPAYSVAKHMDKGLRALRRLSVARGQVVVGRSHVLRARPLEDVRQEWQRLRDAYIETMVDAGRQRPGVVARLDLLQNEYLRKQDRQMRDLSRARLVTEQSRLRRERQSARAHGRATHRKLQLEMEIEGILRRWGGLCARGQTRCSGFVPEKISLPVKRWCNA